MIDNYQDFAEFYDETTTTDVVGKVALLKRLIQTYQPKAKTLLEIGCGTGTVLEHFANKYELTGIDLSQPMLDIAAHKVPTAAFQQADMTTLELGKKYDIIICIFDTINHLLKFEQWEQALGRAAAHAKPGTLFIFDVNTVSKLKMRAQDEPVQASVGDHEVIANMLERGSGVYEWQIEVDGQPIVVPETAFPLERIKTAAQKHFEVKEMLADDGAPATEGVPRAYFVCVK